MQHGDVGTLPRLQEEPTVPVIGVLTPRHTRPCRRRATAASTAGDADGRSEGTASRARARCGRVVPSGRKSVVPLIESEDPYAAETELAVRERAAPLKEAA